MEIFLMLPLPVILAYVFLFGIFFGSFLNVLSDRLSREETIGGRSYCEHCKHLLSTKDLIPVFSFISLHGKCRYCNVKLSYWYILSEILTGLFFAITAYLYLTFLPVNNIFLFLIYMGIAACLMVIILADLKYHIIPDEMQIALALLAVIKILLIGFSWQIVLQSLLAGIIVMLPILFLFLVTLGKGMGFGDVKLAFVMGLLLGWAQGLLALYIGFISGAIVGSFLLILSKTKLKSKIAFGPFLVLGLYVMLFYGNIILTYVRNFYGF